VLVVIDDENDNWPIITYPSLENSTFHVSSQVPLGHHLLDVIATDKDMGINAQLSYHLVIKGSANVGVRFNFSGVVTCKLH